MQSTNLVSVKEALDLDADAADSVCFEPMDFRPTTRLVVEPDNRLAFELPPATLAISFPQLPKLPDRRSDGNDFDLDNSADDPERHLRSVVDGDTGRTALLLKMVQQWPRSSGRGAVVVASLH
jgi:hypothetical protein